MTEETTNRIIQEIRDEIQDVRLLVKNCINSIKKLDHALVVENSNNSIAAGQPTSVNSDYRLKEKMK